MEQRKRTKKEKTMDITEGGAMVTRVRSNGPDQKKYNFVEINIGRRYDANRTFANNVQNMIDHNLKSGAVRSIDPNAIQCPQLTGIQLKRAMARKILKRHHWRSDFMRSMNYKSKHGPLTEAQCDAVINVGREIDEREKDKAASE